MNLLQYLLVVFPLLSVSYGDKDESYTDQFSVYN